MNAVAPEETLPRRIGNKIFKNTSCPPCLKEALRRRYIVEKNDLYDSGDNLYIQICSNRAEVRPLKTYNLRLKFQTCRFFREIHNSEYSGPGKSCQQQDNNRLMDEVNHQRMSPEECQRTDNNYRNIRNDKLSPAIPV